ncbi:MAG: peptidase, partial [Pirellulales bacterium]|nr:peptidase [Pirellulales bacterium]
MTSRKRNNSSTSSSAPARSQRGAKSSRLEKQSSRKKRQHLLETLEPRQLLAGPQLIGVQPNDGELIVNGTVRDTAPRVLTLRFDEGQQINSTTLDGIRITRSGQDQTFGTPDDVRIEPGLVTLGDSAQNEVIVRFAERLPDDNYRLEVFGFDDDGLGITGLRNQDGELLQPSIAGQRADVIDFRLSLGALVESVVPQPVVRLEDGSLVQNRNEVVVYFNEDPLFVEDDLAQGSFGNGTEEITVNGEFNRSFDDVTINFEFNPNPGLIAATHDPQDRSITVVFRAGNTFGDVANVINSLDGFTASVTSGAAATAFTAPGPGVLTTIKGNPTQRSAENPRFYQLLLTQDTVRTTDDIIYFPNEVIYDPNTFTARLFFDGDINNLPGVPVGGGTFRLRVGTAVDDRVDLILPPTDVPVAASAVTDFQHQGLRVVFASRTLGEGASGRQIRFEDSGAGDLSVRLETGGTVVFDFGGSVPEVSELVDVVAATPAVAAVIDVAFELDGVVGGGANLALPLSVVDAPPMVLQAVGDTLETALDVGIFGQFNALKSLVLTESIDPQPFDIELQGGADDPGHTDEVEHINQAFGADTTDGVTDIAYNFNEIFDTNGAGSSFLNQITEIQKTRIREALNLWSSEIGVQFRETENEGITFALGDTGNLQPRPGVGVTSFGVLDASLRIDPTFNEPALVFSNQANFGTAYGEDFTRKAVAGIGLLLGLNPAPDLPAPTVMSLNPVYLNASIDVLTDFEPVFPNNFDVLHGRYVHRLDSIDIDLYRFEVDLNDADRLGTLTAETFAERLPDSSLLDTSLQLFEEVSASATTDLGEGADLEVTIESLLTGRQGNNSRIDFIQTDRGVNDNAVRILRSFDNSGVATDNGILVDLPRTGVVLAGDVVAAINNDPFASSIFRASLTKGDAATDIGGNSLSFSPLLLSGGGLVQLSRNDDYFGEDSRIVASLGEGVYYLGVSASGNDTYDPTIPGSGFGGRTQGLYDLHLKFEPQVDEVDVIRDLDSDRVDVPGTPLDGDGEGTPGGVNNFWFQTRPLNRLVEFTDAGDAIVPGQAITIVSGSGVTRTYEFVPNGGSPRPGNVPVFYSTGVGSLPTPAFILANQLAAQVNSRLGETGVSIAPVPGTSILEFSGERSISLSAGFRGVEVFGRNLFVDKTAGPLAEGSLDRPFNNIANPDVANAFGSSLERDIVRIVGNGGADNDITTEVDNFSYQIGVSDVGGQRLEDGRNMEVPRGVTTVIDAGAAFKLRNSFIGIGSSTVQVDRSGGALQVLGTPRLVQLSTGNTPVKTELLGNDDADTSGYDDGSVIFTSSRDRAVDLAAAGISPAPFSGNWGGLIYRREIDQAEGRRDLEDEGIFLQRVNHAEIRYGGGSNVLIDSVQQLVNPIQIVNMRPTVTFNEITQSADSAVSAAPNSFEETSYQAPRFQQGGAFTADYDRVGPEIHNNFLIDNSINGLFIRATTTPTQTPQQFNVAARFDDVDIVHFVSENLTVAAAPGGSIQDNFTPSLALVSARRLAGGTLPAGDFQYRMTFVDRDGFETLASDVFNFTVSDANSSIELTSLPQVPDGGEFVSRRLYRAPAGANPEFRLVADLDGSSIGFIDSGTTGEAVLDLTRQGIRGRLDASLVFDPGLVTKLRGARIELGQGTQLLAEGLASDPVIFTSSLNDGFGAGGTFDTNNDNDTITGAVAPQRADWSGIYAGPTSNISLDHVEVSYAGGISLLEGGFSRGFLPLELQQATGRITNSVFEFNDDGQAGAGDLGRFGRLAITPATIMVRGSQPIIVGNSFIDNRGSIIDIDIESLNDERRIDIGRQTGDIDRFSVLDDNYGPAIRFNRYLNDVTSGSQLSGLEVRGGTITTATVFDDTDIAHLVFDDIVVTNFHSSGGLRLLSRPDESLVVKFDGSGTPNSDTFGTGITATGATAGVTDRIGGTVHVIGLPGAPVILTSLNDDTVGAGLKPDGSQFTDHDGDGIGTRPFANDWRGLFFDQFSNDFNIPVLPELELSTEVAPGLNADVENAQFLGELAQDLLTGDHVRRLGFEVDGFLSGTNDIDVYSFIGSPGTEVWVDIDTSSFTLDTVIELLDENGTVLARSDNSFAETALGGGTPVTVFDADLDGVTTSLQAGPEAYTDRGAGGLIEDFNSDNPRDAGIHFRLSGNISDPNARSVYFFRVRSASINPDDAEGGLTGGRYRFQVRLTEEQAFPGSV